MVRNDSNLVCTVKIPEIIRLQRPHVFKKNLYSIMQYNTVQYSKLQYYIGNTLLKYCRNNLFFQSTGHLTPTGINISITSITKYIMDLI